MHMLVFIFIWNPCTNMGTVCYSDYIWETRHCCKLPFNVGLLIYSVGEFNVGTAQIIYAFYYSRHYSTERRQNYSRPKNGNKHVILNFLKAKQVNIASSWFQCISVRGYSSLGASCQKPEGGQDLFWYRNNMVSSCASLQTWTQLCTQIQENSSGESEMAY